MATVKCLSLEGDSLPSGRRLIPGETADNVDVTEPDTVARIAAGRLAVVSDDFDVAGSNIPDIFTWVANDPERAAIALAAERARGDAARATLTDKLAELAGTTDDSPQED